MRGRGEGLAGGGHRGRLSKGWGVLRVHHSGLSKLPQAKWAKNFNFMWSDLRLRTQQMHWLTLTHMHTHPEVHTVHAHLHTCMHITLVPTPAGGHTLVHIHTPTWVGGHTHMHIHTRAPTHTCTYTHMHTHLGRQSHPRAHTRAPTHTCTYTHMHTHTHGQAVTHTCTYIHAHKATSSTQEGVGQ